MTASPRALRLIPYRQDETDAHQHAVNRFSYWFVFVGGLLILIPGVATWYVGIDVSPALGKGFDNPFLVAVRRRYEYVSFLDAASAQVFLMSILAFLPLQAAGVAGLFRIYRREVLRPGIGVPFNPRHFWGLGIAVVIYLIFYAICFHVDVENLSGVSRLRLMLITLPAYPFFYSMSCFVMSVCLMNLIVLVEKIRRRT